MTDLLNHDLAVVRARLRLHSGMGADQRCAVAGFDGTASSAAALAYARGWAERNHGAVVVVHVDATAGATLAGCACAMAGVVVPDLPPRDMSADVDEAMADLSAGWAYLNVRGDVADQLERIARALEADVIVVGRSARPRRRIAPSVNRRLLATTRHIIVIV
jgi:nucleotide-binding universal stress UspA family protein